MTANPVDSAVDIAEIASMNRVSAGRAVAVPILLRDPSNAPLNSLIPQVALAPIVPTVVARLVTRVAIAAPTTSDLVDSLLPPPTTTSTLFASSSVNPDDFVRVQWVETWFGGTSQTWIPKTITFQFRPWPTQAPLPGKGEIGMGTLTDEPGKTKTILVGAAPTQAAGWIRGVVAAMGVGVVGIVL